jgi:hypothetical protein
MISSGLLTMVIDKHVSNKEINQVGNHRFHGASGFK